MSLNILQDHNLDIQVELLNKVRKFDGNKIVEEFEYKIPLELNVILDLNIEKLLSSYLVFNNSLLKNLNLFSSITITL